MAKCPKCGVTLLEDSGLVTCHGCGAIVIIDQDGNPLVDNGESDQVRPIEPAVVVTSRDLSAGGSFGLSTRRSDRASSPLDPLEYLGGLDQPQASDQGQHQSHARDRGRKPDQDHQQNHAQGTHLPTQGFSSTSDFQINAGFEPAASHPDMSELNEPVNESANESAYDQNHDQNHDPKGEYFDGRIDHSGPEAGDRQINDVHLSPDELRQNADAFPLNPDFSEFGGYDSAPSAEHGGSVQQDPGDFQTPDFLENGVEGTLLSEDDPLGLNSFANSEVSAASDGMLVFRIFIDGIDTKEIRANLRASMDDQRFNWDLSQVLGHLKNGQLIIEKITPVKAMVLIKRIKQMPVRIRWEQYTIAEVEDETASLPPEYETN